MEQMAKFIMVKRGHCSNPTKVRNVQDFGGAIAIIIDNIEEDMGEIVMTDYSCKKVRF